MDDAAWQVLVAVAERESLSDAARELGLSQSGVSYTVKSLEERTGLPLFVRHRRGVSLTEPGRALLPAVYDLLNSQEKLRQTVAQLKGLAQGSVRVGAYSSVAATWLPDVLARFKAEHPGVSVELFEGAESIIEERLQENALDLAVISRRARPGFEWIELERDRLLAVSRAEGTEGTGSIGEARDTGGADGAESASRPDRAGGADGAESAGRPDRAGGASDGKPFRLASIEHEPFIAVSDYYNRDLGAALRPLRITPRNVVCRSSDDRAIVAMARKGLGTALLFERVVESCGAEGLSLRTTDPPVARSIGIAVRSLADASPAAQAFIAAVREAHRAGGARKARP